MFSNEPNINSIEKQWLAGTGVIKHNAATKKRIKDLVQNFKDPDQIYKMLAAADLLTNYAIWLTVHQTYAKNIYTDGRKLQKDDFKADPQGHLGGALNMIPAYVGYMLANAISGHTRSWVMEQGHAVSAIDSVNLLMDNLNPVHSKRYSITDKGLSTFARDFYAYKINDKGKQASPLGSHVNTNTAGGFLEGGYLGFASLQYVHMPLPGERLVAFLSDGAFEEQKGADWTSRWWRAEDSGLICPIMIANGRRIDQRTTMDQEGGPAWFADYLKIHDFDPIIFDGRDPAAFAWAILEQESRLKENVANLGNIHNYKIKIPYGIAVAPKGAGFYNEGTNYAHNLPLVTNPGKDKTAADRFNLYASKLFVPLDELKHAVSVLNNHDKTKRKKEKDHPLAHRDVKLKKAPRLRFKKPECITKNFQSEAELGGRGEEGVSVEKLRAHRRDRSPTKFSKAMEVFSPMDAIDDAFIHTVKANPHLRPRVGNPDEMLSNKMNDTLEHLKFRVVEAEGGLHESTLGSVITALNEEAVSAAAFGNKGGINIVVTYEAFGSKMFGQARQDVIFAKHQKDHKQPAKWLSVPIILTSNTWENSKNELSHQDPSMAESMLGETNDVSRVIFPADYNSALSAIKHVYQTHGQVWTIVAPKQDVPLIFDEKDSEKLMKNGAIRVGQGRYMPTRAKTAIVAIGAYQLVEALKASERLRKKKVPHIVSYIAEPGRFRNPRNSGEAAHLADNKTIKEIMPDNIKNVVLMTHNRPELLAGMLQPLLNGRKVSSLGFINEGGTLSVAGMLFVNKCSWAHALLEISNLEHIALSKLLSQDEAAAVKCTKSPDGVLI